MTKKTREHTLKEGDIKIVSKEEAYWNEIKESTEKDIERLEKVLKFNRAIVDLCIDKIIDSRASN